jgi:hypothetical protein
MSASGLATARTGATVATTIVEHRGDARRQVAAVRHPEQRLHRSGRHALRERHQLLGIVRPFFADHHRVVTRALGFETQPPPRHPHQRMEPITRRRYARHDLHDPVSSLNVFEFVQQRAPELGVAPVAGIDREDNHGTSDAKRHRARHGLVLDELDRLLHTARCGELCKRVAVPGHRQAGAAYCRELPEHGRHRNQKQDGANEPDRAERVGHTDRLHDATRGINRRCEW